MAISIKVDVEGQSLVQLNNTIKELRAQQKALTTEGTDTYKQFEDQINSVNSALQEQINTYDVENKSIIQLKQEYKVLKDLQASSTNTDDMIRFASAAGQSADKMKDVNETVAIFSGGTKFEQAGTALKQVGDNLLNLDFAGASEKAKTLVEITKGMSFKGATEGLKDLGKTFLQLGKALLSNPLFLIAAVIVAIGVAIMAVLKHFGVLQKVLNVIKDVVQKVIDVFYALTDAIGLTNHAEEEKAKKNEENHKKRQENAEQELKTAESLHSMTKDLSDEEYKRLNEQLGGELDGLRDLNDIKRSNAEQTIAELEEEIKAMGDKKYLDDEELKKYEEKEKAIESEVQKVQQAERDKANAKMQNALNAEKLLEQLNAKAIANEAGRSKALLDIAEKEAIGKLEAKKREAERGGDLETAKKYEEAITLTKKDFTKQREAIDKGVREKEKADAKSAADAAQSALETRLKKQLDTIKKDNELKLGNLKEGTKEYLDQQLIGLEKELEFARKNNKGLKQDKLDLQLFEQKIAKQKLDLNNEFNEKTLANDNKLALDKAKILQQNAKTEEEVFAARIALIQANLAIELQGVKEGTDEEILIRNKANEDIKAIDLEKTGIIIENQLSVLNQAKASADLEASIAAFELERFKGQQKEKIAAIEEYGRILIQQLDAQKVIDDKNIQDQLDNLEKIKQERGSLSETELNKVKELEEQKKAVEEAYRQSKIIAEEQTQKTIDELKQASIDKGLADAAAMAAGAAEAISMITAIGQSNLDIQENNMNARHAKELENLEEGSAAYEDAKKRQLDEEQDFAKKKFEIDKKQQIAAAVIQGIQAVLSAYSSGSAIPVVGAVTGPVFAALAAVAAAKNIQAIKSTTYQGGGGAPAASSGGTPSIPGADGGTSSAVPSFNLFGQGNNANTTNASAPVMGGGQGPMVVKAVVVESDITNSQANVARYNESATL
jgi:cell shape-determining protein MreC